MKSVLLLCTTLLLLMVVTRSSAQTTSSPFTVPQILNDTSIATTICDNRGNMRVDVIAALVSNVVGSLEFTCTSGHTQSEPININQQGGQSFNINDGGRGFRDTACDVSLFLQLTDATVQGSRPRLYQASTTRSICGTFLQRVYVDDDDESSVVSLADSDVDLPIFDLKDQLDEGHAFFYPEIVQPMTIVAGFFVCTVGLLIFKTEQSIYRTF